MLQDLLDVKRILDKYKTEFFLLGGTALGAYRDKDFIEGDDDIDLGSFDDTHREDIKEDLKELGFSIAVCYNIETGEHIPSKMILAKRNTQVDIFFFEWDGKKYVAHRDGFSDPWTFLYKGWKLEDIEFKGETYKVLSPIEKYLEWTYTNWRKKEKERGIIYNDVFKK